MCYIVTRLAWFSIRLEYFVQNSRQLHDCVLAYFLIRTLGIVKSPDVNFCEIYFCNDIINVVATSLNFLLDFLETLNQQMWYRADAIRKSRSVLYIFSRLGMAERAPKKRKLNLRGMKSP